MPRLQNLKLWHFDSGPLSWLTKWINFLVPGPCPSYCRLVILSRLVSRISTLSACTKCTRGFSASVSWIMCTLGATKPAGINTWPKLACWQKTNKFRNDCCWINRRIQTLKFTMISNLEQSQIQNSIITDNPTAMYLTPIYLTLQITFLIGTTRYSNFANQLHWYSWA